MRAMRLIERRAVPDAKNGRGRVEVIAKQAENRAENGLWKKEPAAGRRLAAIGGKNGRREKKRCGIQ